MNARKLALLVVILMLGGALEGAFSVRNHINFGPSGCRVRGRFDGPSFTFDEERQLTVPAGLRLRVDNAFGQVHVAAGPADTVRVRLHKQVFAPDESQARELSQRVALRAVLTGAALGVGTNRRELENDLDDDLALKTSFELEVPADTRVVVVNEHGPLDVSGVQSVELETSHDALHVEHIQGDTKVTVRHGEIHVASIGGEVTLQGRHGDVTVREVGRLTADIEHGDLEVVQASDTEVRLEHGKASLSRLAGPLRFKGEHAEIDTSDVAGDVSVETSHRDVKLRDVKGAVHLKLQHGGGDVADVTGAVDVDAAYGDLELARIGGRVELKLEHGALRSERLAGGGRVRASGGDVILDGFKGPFEVDTQRAGVRLVPDGALVETLRVVTKNGDVHLEVPLGSRFDVQADARFGEVHAEDVAELSVNNSSDDRLRARVGAGGALVTLSSEHGDIHLDGRSAQARDE